MNYFLMIVIGALASALFALSIKLFMNTRGSLLYSKASQVGVLGTIGAVLFLSNYFVDFEVNLYQSVIFSLLNLCLYSLWKITYNQIDKKRYTILLYTVLGLSLMIDYLVSQNILLVNESLVSLSNYHIINFIVLIFIIVKYFQFSRMNNTYELNFVPLVLLLYLLSELSILVLSAEFVLIFTILKTVSLVLLLLFYTKDYKNSFYY